MISLLFTLFIKNMTKTALPVSINIAKRYYPGRVPKIPSNLPSNTPSNPGGALIPYTKPADKDTSSPMKKFCYQTDKAINEVRAKEAADKKAAQDLADKLKGGTLKQNMDKKMTPIPTPTDATQLSPLRPVQSITAIVVGPAYRLITSLGSLGAGLVSRWYSSSSKDTQLISVPPVPVSPVSVPPVPPVMPVTPTLPATPTPIPQTEIVPQKDMASENDTTLKTDAANITKVSSEPGSSVAAVTYKTQSGIKYTTTMTTGTTPNNITDSQLIDEMRKRELIKPDPNCTAVVVKTIDDTDFLLGSSKNKVKLSSLGQAYYNKVSPKVDDNALQANKIPQVQEKDFEFLIITPPKGNANVFVEIGLHKHLLIVHDTCKDLYFGLTYLTSKHSGISLSNQQLKAFQDQQENKKASNTLGKEQHAVSLDRAILINKADVHRVKWDKEYIDSLSKVSKDFLQNTWNEIQMQPYKLFNFDGITKQDCIHMCLEHDEIAKANGKHPLTQDQIMQNEANKTKQMQKNKANKDADNNLLNTPFT